MLRRLKDCRRPILSVNNLLPRDIDEVSETGGDEFAVFGEILNDRRGCSKGHQGYFVIGSELPKPLSDVSPQRAHDVRSLASDINQQDHRKRQLAAAEM